MQKKGFKFEMNNRVYGIVGLGALFLVGMVFGFILNGSDRPNPSMMRFNRRNFSTKKKRIRSGKNSCCTSSTTSYPARR